MSETCNIISFSTRHIRNVEIELWNTFISVQPSGGLEEYKLFISCISTDKNIYHNLINIRLFHKRFVCLRIIVLKICYVVVAGVVWNNFYNQGKKYTFQLNEWKNCMYGKYSMA